MSGDAELGSGQAVEALSNMALESVEMARMLSKVCRYECGDGVSALAALRGLTK